MLVAVLVVLSLQLGSRVASASSSPNIPNYQWKFLSPSEKAAVNASVRTIMSQRIKNITLSIVDASGVPYTGKLQVTQTSTEFINTAGWPAGDWNDYLAMTPSHSFALYAPWSVLEAVRGTWDFSTPDWQFTQATGHGMTDFHMFLGPYYGQGNPDYFVPDWEKALEKSARSNASDYEALKNAMRGYVETTVSHFKGRVQLYELWWEANAYYGNGNWPLDRIIDIIKTEALTIRATDPAAKISVDLVYETPDTLQYLSGSSNWTTEHFTQQLLAAGVPFDVVGLETHIGTGSADAAGDVDTLYHWLIDMAEFGKPLYIWEDGLESYLPPDWVANQGPPGWVGPLHGTPSEAKQAEFMVAETLVYFGNPSVIGLHWVRLNDNPTWNGSSNANDYDGVLYANGTRKMSYYALERLWNSLMVNENIQSVNGVATFRGLAGNYSIWVGYQAGPSVIHVSEGKQNTFSLVMKPTTGIASTMNGSVTANETVPASAPQVVENPVLILAGALGIVIVLVAAIILRRRRPSG